MMMMIMRCCVICGSDLSRLFRRFQSSETTHRRLPRMSQPNLEQPSSSLVPLRHRPLQPLPHRAELPATAVHFRLSTRQESPPPVATTSAGSVEEPYQRLGGRDGGCLRRRGEGRSTDFVPDGLDQLEGCSGKPPPWTADGQKTGGPEEEGQRRITDSG